MQEQGCEPETEAALFAIFRAAKGKRFLEGMEKIEYIPFFGNILKGKGELSDERDFWNPGAGML